MSYLPGLNTIRLYAAVCVILSHIPNLSLAGFPVLSGMSAVTLFFVLSGFLITAILLKEQSNTGTINVRRFYWRRSLRILPLYFVVMVVGALILQYPYQPTALAWLQIVTFTVPFAYAMGIGAGLGSMAHLWSIAVEEVFYLVYPPLIARYGVVRVCITIIAVQGLITLVVGDTSILFHLSRLYRVECMAIGGLVAWAWHQRHSSLKVLTHPVVAWSMALLAALMAFGIIGDEQTYVFSVMQSLVFAVVILNMATNRAFPSLEHRWASWWGQRTYGIYMWHYPIIGVLSVMAIGNSTIVLALTLLLTGIVAVVSYHVLEKPILQLKDLSKHQKRAYSSAFFVPENDQIKGD